MKPVRMILLGAPASGKGTQSERLVRRYGIVKISTGDMLRAARAAGDPLGQRVAQVMDAGGLVPDQLVIDLVDQRLAAADAEAGFVLDGFPRTVPQAEELGRLLGKHGQAIGLVVLLEVSRDLLVERATLRRTDIRTGQIYHLKYSPPPDTAELVQREDDRQETVVKRLEAYDTMTSSLIPYYEQHRVLRRVDGVGDPGDVEARIRQAVETAFGGSGGV
jgi:adenylate kinase